MHKWTTSEACLLLGGWVESLMHILRELWGETKGVDERIDEGVLRWFGHGERMDRDRIAKRVYVAESVLVFDQWVSHGRNGLMP